MYKRFEDDYSLPIYSLTVKEFGILTDRLRTRKRYDARAIEESGVPASITDYNPSTKITTEYYDLQDLISNPDLISPRDVSRFYMVVEELFAANFSHDSIVMEFPDDRVIWGDWDTDDVSKIEPLTLEQLFIIAKYGAVESDTNNSSYYFIKNQILQLKVMTDGMKRLIESVEPTVIHGVEFISIDQLTIAFYKMHQTIIQDTFADVQQFMYFTDGIPFCEQLYIMILLDAGNRFRTMGELLQDITPR